MICTWCHIPYFIQFWPNFGHWYAASLLILNASLCPLLLSLIKNLDLHLLEWISYSSLVWRQRSWIYVILSKAIFCVHAAWIIDHQSFHWSLHVNYLIETGPKDSWKRQYCLLLKKFTFAKHCVDLNSNVVDHESLYPLYVLMPDLWCYQYASDESSLFVSICSISSWHSWKTRQSL